MTNTRTTTTEPTAFDRAADYLAIVADGRLGLADELNARELTIQAMEAAGLTIRPADMIAADRGLNLPTGSAMCVGCRRLVWIPATADALCVRTCGGRAVAVGDTLGRVSLEVTARENGRVFC